jgi:hypothetical protein
MTNDASITVEDLQVTMPNEDLWGSFRVNTVEGDRLGLVGWAIGIHSDVRQIELLYTGTVVASVTPALERPDLVEVFPDRDVSSSGFEIAVAATGRGQSQLDLEALLADGRRATLGTVTVTTPKRWPGLFRRP